MERIYDSLARLVAAGETVAVATVVEVRGSVPREVGAKMVIHPLGQHIGTVGGGCGEAEVIRAATEVIRTGVPDLVGVDLTEDISMQSLGVCGGTMSVFVERVSGATNAAEESDESHSPGARIAALRSSIEAREPVALATVVTGANAGSQAAVWLDRDPLWGLQLGSLESRALADIRSVLQARQHRLLTYPEAGTSVFVEVERRAPELLVVGAGHIALPLAQIASLSDFSVTVLDDRRQFASPERFPTANRVIAAPLRETLRELPTDEDTFVVLVTRGHSQDVECLLEVLNRPVAYIGMIGSERRISAVFELLSEERGIDPTLLDKVSAPIGIAIGARTPAEIAVCIMAEVINVLRGGPAVSISDRRRERDHLRREQHTP
jgi:xanthine dehydrogenase accessory factor